MDALKSRSTELRKNMTDAERKLWTRLRDRRLCGFKFRRQQPLGRYIVDFVCFEKKVVIELDGSQHMTQEDYDSERTAWLRKQGFRVLRFWNNQVLAETNGVMEVIRHALTPV